MAGDTGRESPPNLEGLHEVTDNPFQVRTKFMGRW